MTAKEAVLKELGDFGKEEPEKQDQVSSADPLEGERFEVDDNGEIVGFKFLAKEEVEDDEMDGGEESTAESEDYDLKSLSSEELDACIQAVDETMDTSKLSPEMVDWGVDLIRKAYEEKDARLRERFLAIDRQARREQWAREAEEDEEREMADLEERLEL